MLQIGGRFVSSLITVFALFAALVLLDAVAPPQGHAAANRIYDQGAAAAAQANAFTAQADDPSAIYYNPAGMTQLRGVQTSFGVLLIGGSTSFRNSTGATAESSFDGSVAYPLPLNLYATANLKDLGVTSLGDLTVGIGALIPFGTLMRWPENGPFNTVRTFSAMELVDIKPTIAYKVNDSLSLGLGLDIYTFFDWYGEGQLERRSNDPNIGGGAGIFAIPAGQQVEIGVEDTAVGFNASFLYTPFRNADGKPLANVGFIYRSQATFHAEGRALVNGTFFANAEQTIVLPQVFTGGIALWPVRNQDRELKFELDVDLTGWKSVRNLDVRLSRLTNLGTSTLAFPQDWRNTYTVMIGSEYKMLRYPRLPNWEVAFRAGYWHSQTPIPDKSLDPEIPDSDSHMIAFGVGMLCKAGGRFLGIIPCGSQAHPFAPKEIGIDTAFQVLLYEPRTVTGNTLLRAPVNGDYDTTFYIGAINLRLNF